MRWDEEALLRMRVHTVDSQNIVYSKFCEFTENLFLPGRLVQKLNICTLLDTNGKMFTIVYLQDGLQLKCNI